MLNSLEASKFKPSKSQRSIINKFNTFIQEGGREGQEGYGPLDGTAASTSQLPDIKGKGKFKGKNVQTFDLVDSIHASEYSARAAQAAAHRFEVCMSNSWKKPCTHADSPGSETYYYRIVYLHAGHSGTCFLQS